MSKIVIFIGNLEKNSISTQLLGKVIKGFKATGAEVITCQLFVLSCPHSAIRLIGQTWCMPFLLNDQR